MNCQRFDQWTALWVEGDLDARKQALVEEHVAGCSRCTEMARQLRASQQTLRALRQEFVEPGQLEAIRAGVLRELSTQEPAGRQWLGWIFGGRRAWRYASLATLFFLAVGGAAWWLSVTPGPRREIVREGPSIELLVAPSDSVAQAGSGVGAVAERATDNFSSIQGVQHESGRLPTLLTDTPGSTTATAASTIDEEPDTHDWPLVVPSLNDSDDGPRNLIVEEAVINPSADANGSEGDGVRLRLATNNPDVVLYWLVGGNGD